MNTKIYSCFHKDYYIPKNNLIEPIHVGKEISSNELNILGDNTGENISIKNPNYCELTALYWIWKNSKADIVGLCHYRRYFNVKDLLQINEVKTIRSEDLTKCVDFENKSIKKFFDKGYDIIVPKANKFKNTIYEHYCEYHKKEDIDELIKVINRLYPEYSSATEKVLNGKQMHIYNMFICKKEILDDYCQWLFNILFEIEKIVEIDSDPYQARIFGFMSERLLNIYIEKNKLNKKELQVLFVED